MNKDMRIAVIKANWVLVGNYSIDPKTRMVTLTDSAVIETWGTTKGIGQLAASGPTPNTVLRPCGIADIPESQILFTLRVLPKVAAAWPK